MTVPRTSVAWFPDNILVRRCRGGGFLFDPLWDVTFDYHGEDLWVMLGTLFLTRNAGGYWYRGPDGDVRRLID